MTAPVQDAVLSELAETALLLTARELSVLVYRHVRDPFYAKPITESERVVKTLAALEDKGYAERVGKAGRSALWRITPAGRRHHDTTETP